MLPLALRTNTSRRDGSIAHMMPMGGFCLRHMKAAKLFVGQSQRVMEWRRKVDDADVLIFLLLCTPALAHDPGRPQFDEWFDRLTPAGGYVGSRTALLSAMLIGD